MANGSITRPAPAQPKSFIVPFVVDLEGRRFGKYPPGWPALLSLGVRAGIPWLLNPILAGVAVWLTYRMGTRFLPEGLAFVGSLLLASSPMVWMQSGSLMSHNLGLVLGLAFASAWLDLFPPDDGGGKVPRGLLIGVAGMSLALLGLTRPLTALAIALPFGFDALVDSLRGRCPWRRMLAVALVGLSTVALLPLWNYAVTGDALRNPYTLWWSYDRFGFGTGHGNMEGGHTLRLAYLNTKFSLRVGLHDLFGWPFLSWLFLPFGLIPVLRRRSGRLILAVFPALVLLYGAYWIGAWLLGPRYYYECLPGLATTSAAGVGWLGGWLHGWARWRWRRLATTGLVGALVAVNLFFYLPTRVDGLHGLYGIDRAAMAPLERAELERALIIVDADHWSGYANLRLLTPPFTDRDLLVAWSRGAGPDGNLERSYPEHQIFYHDPDEPAVLIRP